MIFIKYKRYNHAYNCNLLWGILLISEKMNNIFINGKKETIKNVDHDITLLDWLRNNLKMTGTKEGCAEGDCGACSVIINEENQSNLKPVNSCLVRIGQVIGKNIVTIEGLGNDNDPHPLQVAFSKENASQCGYCTPGFIVAGVSLLNSNKEINDNTINDAFSGNLCRCTGYSPIINAVKSVPPAKNLKFFVLIRFFNSSSFLGW